MILPSSIGGNRKIIFRWLSFPNKITMQYTKFVRVGFKEKIMEQIQFYVYSDNLTPIKNLLQTLRKSVQRDKPRKVLWDGSEQNWQILTAHDSLRPYFEGFYCRYTECIVVSDASCCGVWMRVPSHHFRKVHSIKRSQSFSRRDIYHSVCNFLDVNFPDQIYQAVTLPTGSFCGKKLIYWYLIFYACERGQCVLQFDIYFDIWGEEGCISVTFRDIFSKNYEKLMHLPTRHMFSSISKSKFTK